MGTLDSIFPATRQSLLVQLYGRPDQEFYHLELVRAVGKGHGAVQRELENLVSGGLVVREKRKGRTYFQANRQCPIFEELRRIVVKTAGLVELLQEALGATKGVAIAFVYGSIARGQETPESDVDLALIGTLSFKKSIASLAPVQDALGREINPTLFTPREFTQKAHRRNHFVRALLDEEKLFIIGTAKDLGRLTSKP